MNVVNPINSRQQRAGGPALPQGGFRGSDKLPPGGFRAV
jgi:hypothetical protein